MATTSIEVHSKRESVGLTISACKEFAKLQCDFLDQLTGPNPKPAYSGEIGSFNYEHAPQESVDWAKSMNDLKLDLDMARQCASLDNLASLFVHGIADADLAFSIIGDDFCSMVRVGYPWMIQARTDRGLRSFEDTVALYKAWSTRLDKLGAEKTHKEYLQKAREAMTKAASYEQSEFDIIGVKGRQPKR